MTTADVLAFGAHPDDVELTVGGSLLLARSLGLETAIAHLTAGEMGTRGTADTRRAEARAAAEELGVTEMRILDLPDGHVAVDDVAKDRVIRAIREFRPRVVLAPWIEDLHPDHEATGRVVAQAAFLAGLARWETGQRPWRPSAVYHYMSHTGFDPDLIVDVSAHFERKKSAAARYASQFHDPKSREPKTYISGPNFWTWWEARHRHYGHLIGVEFGEPLCVRGPIPSRNPFELFDGFGKYRNET